MSTFELELGGRQLSVQTGKLAQQAGGSAVLRYGDSVLLVTATMSKPREGIDFFPLTIDFEERMYARGKIPGSFFRREGRPSADAILICRLTDRPLRPLFPKGFRNEVQVITTPLSVDLENPLDIISINGASLAVTLSDIPFDGPLGATRVGHVDGEYVINPTFEQVERSKLDLIVAGSGDGVMMIEAGACELSEDAVYRAIELGQEQNLRLVEFQRGIAASEGKPKAEYAPPRPPEGLPARIESAAGGRLGPAVDHSISPDKDTSRIAELRDEVTEALADEFEPRDVRGAFEAQVDDEFRSRMLEGVRPDGRGPTEIRPLSAEVGLLPRTHGTGLFQRGETQALGIVTLGSAGDAQKLDNINPRESKRFLLHYNFPPYSTGETKRVGSPGRREIGHGALAERAVVPVLPTEEDFPYTVRVVSEILGSNGSSSMASVCAATLSLMDAGVPITAPVAGVSIGLITGDGGRWLALTDIQGKEDHIGDMDFKVAGTREGVTAIQLDMKVKGIDFDVVRAALSQAREARLSILDVMAEAHSGAARRGQPLRPAHNAHQHPGGQDRGGDRPWRQGHQGHHRGDRGVRRRPGRRRDPDRRRGRGIGRKGGQDDRGPDAGRPGGRGLHGQGRKDPRLRRLRRDPARQGRHGAHKRARRLPRAQRRGRRLRGRRDHRDRKGRGLDGPHKPL